MAYCPECGSEVAQNDVFCAFCGIVLPNVSKEPEVVNSSTEYPPTSDLSKENSLSESIQNDTTPVESFSLEDISKTENKTGFEEITDSNVKEGSIETPGKTSQDLVNNIETSPSSMKEEKLVELPNVELPNKEYYEPSEMKESEIIQESLPTSFNEQPESINILDQPETVQKAEPLSSDYSQRNFESQVSDELIDIKIPMNNVHSEEELKEEVETGIEEISEKINDIKEEQTTVNTESQVDYDQTIRDGYFPAKPQTALKEQEKSIQTPTELVEEDKLQSVLDEIDLNLQNQNDIEVQNNEIGVNHKTEPERNDPKLNTGVIISTAANLQEKAFPTEMKSEEIAAPLASVEIPIQTKINESQNVEEQISDLSPVVDELDQKPALVEEKIIKVESKSDSNQEKEAEIAVFAPIEESISEDKEGRSFTNPNIGGAETDNRNKTKLKPLDEGTVLNNRYEIVRKIGGGGMGAVYLATDKNLGGVLRAVKEMVQSYIEDEQQLKAVNDFKRESMLLTSLEHPSIPTIYDYFFDEKEARFYLVMKYISGGDLAARLRSAPEGRIDEVSVTDWAIQITDVLDYLHNRQPPIVYRDLKPSNIMIDGNSGKLMLIDFGIARWVNNKEEKGVTAVGTMGYAPPELFSGNVEPRSDIYSLGSTMFHLLTGADPQSNPLLIFDFNKHPKPRQINPQLSDQMEQILMRAVEYNSIQRFNSAKDMRDELIKHMENLKKGTVTFGVVNTTPGSPINANVPVFCGFCGQKIVATDMFCPFCGAQQPLAAQSKRLVQSPPPYVAPILYPKLVIVGTSDLDSMDYVLEKESNLLGRRDPMSNIFPEVDLSKFDPQTKISRKHARIWREGDVYMLEDLGSSNGTTLISIMNGSIRLLPRQPQVVSHGDKLKLGDTTLRFTIG